MLCCDCVRMRTHLFDAVVYGTAYQRSRTVDAHDAAQLLYIGHCSDPSAPSRSPCTPFKPSSCIACLESQSQHHLWTPRMDSPGRRLTGCRRIELEVPLDDLVHRSQEVLLRSHLSPRPYGEHTCLSSHTPQLSSGAVGAQSRNQLPSDIALYAHTLGVNAQNVGSSLQVWQGKFDLSIYASRTHKSWIQG